MRMAKCAQRLANPLHPLIPPGAHAHTPQAQGLGVPGQVWGAPTG